MMLTAILITLTTLIGTINGVDIEQFWTISYKLVHPDGVPKVVPVVNGQYPGPQLQGHVGQTVRIHLLNKLVTDTTSIHWHGIKQDGTPWSDGMFFFFFLLLLLIPPFFVLLRFSYIPVKLIAYA